MKTWTHKAPIYRVYKHSCITTFLNREAALDFAGNDFQRVTCDYGHGEQQIR